MTTPDLKVVTFDVETTPIKAYTWGRFVDGPVIEVIEDWWMLCVAWKWLHEDETHVLSVTPDAPKDDRHIVQQLWDIFEEADLIVAHNGDQFDIKKAQARMLHYGFQPPSPFKTIDTLKVARKSFKLTSNKLDDICSEMGIGRKLPHTGFKLWTDSMAGDPDALAMMRDYNRVDVEILEELYLMLRPWISNHPHVYRTTNGECASCGSTHVHKHGTTVTKTAVFQRYKCADCGSTFRGRLKDRNIDSQYTTMARK